MYDMPDEIDVKADGALRIITLNRPDDLNAVNDNLHVGLAKIWEALNEDTGARAAVITGAGRAFSAGGDFNYLDELRNDEAAAAEDDQARPRPRHRHAALPHPGRRRGQRPGRRARLQPGRAVRHRLHRRDRVLRRPARAIGLVAADGGPLVWGSQISLLQAKEFALTGVRIKAATRGRVGSGQPRRRRSAGRGDRVREEDHGAAAAGGREPPSG